MRTIRQRRFSVNYAFATQAGDIIGNSNGPKYMLSGDIEYALAMVDPFQYEKWVGDIMRLNRGDKLVIKIVSAHDKHGRVLRLIKVARV